jgi:putative MATE family efflux protein
MLRDPTYYKTLALIAVPIIAQNFVTSSLNVIDITMLGQLGETTVAAVGLANQLFFLLILMMFGIYSGVGVFTAQYWGKGDLTSIRKVLGIGLIMGLMGSFGFSIVGLLFPETFLKFYSTDPAVIAEGASYLRIVGWSYMVTAVTFAYSSVLRSTGMVRIPMIVSICALSIKTFLNYGLILGNFGLPALGADGAAIATVIARMIEFFALLTIVYRKKLPPAARITEMLAFNRAFLTRVLRTSMPVVVNETLWSLGITTYNMVYGRIGTEAIAAVNIAASIEGLAFVIFIGMSDACGIMVGNRIGAGEEDTAHRYARNTIIISTAGAVVIGLIILLGKDLLLSFYNLSEGAMQNANNILLVMGFLLWVRVSNMTLIVGVLRAGGDTRFGLTLDAGTIWGVGVPLALVSGLVLHLPVHIVYLLLMLEELVKYGVAIWRFASRRWITNLVQPAEV